MADLAMPAALGSTPRTSDDERWLPQIPAPRPPSELANATTQALNEAFASIYTANQARITRLVRNQIRSNDPHLADDLTADAFTTAWLSLHQCKAATDAQLYSWLATIARRTVASHYRVKRNTMTVPADLGHWSYANRELDQAGGYYTPADGFRTTQVAR